MSAAPRPKRATRERKMFFDRPKTIVRMPNRKTPANMVIPARRFSGDQARKRAVNVAPSPGALRSSPRPQGPMWRRSRAKIGSRAVDPPKRTAKRSREIDPRIGLFDQTYRRPARTEFDVGHPVARAG